MNNAWIDDLLTFGGSRSKLRLLTVLAEAQKPLYLGEVIDAFASREWHTNRTYLSKLLNDLEKSEFVTADIPPDQRAGRAVRYGINAHNIHQVLSAADATLTQHGKTRR
jgi:hypothetical protein